MGAGGGGTGGPVDSIGRGDLEWGREEGPVGAHFCCRVFVIIIILGI